MLTEEEGWLGMTRKSKSQPSSIMMIISSLSNSKKQVDEP